MKVTYANELEIIDNDSVMVMQDPSYLKPYQLLGKEENQDEELAVVNTNSTDNN